MMPHPTTAAASRQVNIELKQKVSFLLDMHPFKVLYGGRDAIKTHSFCRALLILGADQPLRILCAREIQKSIADSVHQLLCDLIEKYEMGSFYKASETDIVGKNGTRIFYTGLLGHTVESVKSFERLDIVVIFEAQTVSKRSLDILLPTMREPNCEVWAEFNPGMESDAVWQFFMVNPPPGAKIVKMGWQDNNWLSEFSNNLRLHCLKNSPQDYENIWEGKPRTVVAGAIYAREVVEMVEAGRIRPTPYDPKLPVHALWDLGWNDAMSIIMVQKPHPSAINIINYREDSGRRYDELIGELEGLRYRWGFDWMPHDAMQHHPTSGTNAKKTMEGLGRKVKIIPKSDPEARIRAARMMFPSCYIDNTERKVATGYFGGARLIECLKRYKRNIPTTTGEASTPTHDQHSHACLVAGSMVKTAQGDLPIEAVQINDMVWTPAGYSRVIAAGPVKVAAALIEIKTKNTALICTPEHKILTQRGFVRADALGRRDRIYSGKEWQCRLIGLYSRARHISFRGAIIDATYGALRDHRTFIGPSGKMRTAPFHTASTSTTPTATPLTTIFRTYGALIAQNTNESTQKNASKTERYIHQAGPLCGAQPNGTAVQKGGNGTKATARILGRIVSGLSAIAIGVVNLTVRLILSAPSSATSVVNGKHAPSDGGARLVYDLTVEKNACYQASGLLVSNCDAFGGLAEIVAQIRSEFEKPPQILPAYSNPEPSMGLLG